LAGEGRHALSAADAATAAERLRCALALWRGSPLADCTYESFAQTEIARLEEARTTSTEDRIEADLALGRHGQLVAELERLVREHPVLEPTSCATATDA
jgi:DNA-binding SARP family transcriptional activator